MAVTAIAWSLGPQQGLSCIQAQSVQWQFHCCCRSVPAAAQAETQPCAVTGSNRHSLTGWQDHSSKLRLRWLDPDSDDWIFFQFQSFCAHFSYKLPRWVSICPDGVSFCPEYHPQPHFFTQSCHTPFGDMYVHKTPPSPPQNTPFPGLNLKVGIMNYSLGNSDPNRAKWKVGKTFLKWAKKIIHLTVDSTCKLLQSK